MNEKPSQTSTPDDIAASRHKAAADLIGNGDASYVEGPYGEQLHVSPDAQQEIIRQEELNSGLAKVAFNSLHSLAADRLNVEQESETKFKELKDSIYALTTPYEAMVRDEFLFAGAPKGIKKRTGTYSTRSGRSIVYSMKTSFNTAPQGYQQAQNMKFESRNPEDKYGRSRLGLDVQFSDGQMALISLDARNSGLPKLASSNISTYKPRHILFQSTSETWDPSPAEIYNPSLTIDLHSELPRLSGSYKKTTFSDEVGVAKRFKCTFDYQYDIGKNVFINRGDSGPSELSITDALTAIQQTLAYIPTSREASLNN